MAEDPHAPYFVHKLDVSYFSGKLEAYLRYKEIPYEFCPMSRRRYRELTARTGAFQVPGVELPDGRWMTDTTPMIAWFEAAHPEPRVIPAEPLLAFVSQLLEDHADEWLWRPAMHYRWSYAADRRLLSDFLVWEMLVDMPLPHAAKLLLIRRRQRGTFVRGDGVDAHTWDHVEGSYLRMLDALEEILQRRPFVLGDVPSLADFGFMGPCFRHFGHDPTPLRIMQNRAPGVFAWIARVWNARGSRQRGSLLGGVPADLSPLLREVGATHLEQLCANALAFAAGRRRFDATIQGVRYRRLPTSRYRVWCLEQLRALFDALPGEAREEGRALLEAHGCWEPLWRVPDLRSGYEDERNAPFTGLPVFSA